MKHLWLMVGILILSGQALAANPDQTEFFEKHIRPLLAEHCYKCHSVQAKTLRAHLYLDSREGWMTGGDSGPAIVPGEPDASLLLRAVRYKDENLRMPPNRKLPAQAIALLELWVASGAVDPRDEPTARRRRGIDIEAAKQDWPYTHPKAHPTPEIKDVTWPNNPIDRFILARLEQAGLKPAPDADRRTLIRRVSYDLTGLPPSPEQVEAFADDASPQAMERMVDRLLASDAYGEHWGRHWLDLARYADSNGADFNKDFTQAWRYRNYVIESFNADRPYDVFLREQIAGDLMQGGSLEEQARGMTATGYLTLSAKMLSERDKEKLALDIVDEQLDAVGMATMGMTLGCARCHDHKFAPISMQDYYGLAGIFRSTHVIQGEFQQYVSKWVERDLPVPGEQAEALSVYHARRDALAKQVEETKKKHEQAKKEVAKAKRTWLGIVVDDEQAQFAGKWKKSTYNPRFVGVGYAHDDKQDKGKKSATFRPDLPAAGEYEVRLSYTSGSGRDRQVPVRVRHADGVEKVTIDQEPRPPIEDMFLPLGRFRFEKGKAGSVTIETGGTEGYVIVDAVQFVPVAELTPGREWLASTHAPGMGDADRMEAAVIYRALVEIEKNLEALEADAPAPAPKVMAVTEAEKPGDIRLCIRGESHNRGPVVPRRFIEVMSDDDGLLRETSQSGRAEFAAWLTRPNHPLTSRVIVNRIWSHLLGEGIVRSVDNFTALGERPTHPELLDTLADSFVKDGWSFKRLIRQVVLSRTYAMSSTYDEVKFLKDPDNKLLWCAPRKRLTAESIRDTLLLVSGRLDRTSGGAVFDKDGKVDSSHPYRRSVYLPLKRGDIPTLLQVFDFADTEMVVGQRPKTNVPAQALAMMNSPFVRDAAKRIANDLLKLEMDDAARANHAFMLLLGRPVFPAEAAQLTAYASSPMLTEGAPVKPAEAWARAVQAIVASTGFRMLD